MCAFWVFVHIGEACTIVSLRLFADRFLNPVHMVFKTECLSNILFVSKLCSMHLTFFFACKRGNLKEGDHFKSNVNITVKMGIALNDYISL